MFRIALIAALSLVQAADRPAQLPAPTTQAAGETRIFIVRHAEKDTTVKSCPGGGSICQPLTAEGAARAAELARLLKTQPLKKIFSTEYKRTQDTASPSDRSPSIWTSLPARTQLDAAIAEIAKEPGTYLIVTHSDVVIPFLRKLLGNDQIAIAAGAMPNMNPPNQIIDDPDYDNLFLVTLPPPSSVAAKSCQHFFFGAKTATDLAVTGCAVQGRLQ